jgi:hypothetical protein
MIVTPRNIFVNENTNKIKVAAIINTIDTGYVV